MKKCLRKKCKKDFEPNKPKQLFCSAKCRVYFSREEKIIKTDTPPKEPPKNKISKLKKEMPDGLDKGAILRWLRENG